MKNLRWFIISILITANFAMASLSYVAPFVEGRTEEFNDTNNNLQIDLEVPDYWNSVKLSGKIFNFGWNLSSLAVTDEYLDAFFVVTNLPPEANILLPIGMRTGVLSFLVSQYGIVNKEYNVSFADGSVGYAYDVSINPNQLQRLKVTTNDSFDLAILGYMNQFKNSAI